MVWPRPVGFSFFSVSFLKREGIRWPQSHLALNHPFGEGIKRNPTRICIYLSSYGTGDTCLGPAEGMPILTSISYDLAEFENSVNAFKSQLDSVLMEAKERWG